MARVNDMRLADRFWAKVYKQEGDACWLWTASKFRDGYGKFARGGHSAGMVRAHRVSWELHNGSITDGLFVLHDCDTPACVRPDHLFLGTAKDNVRDMIAKGRQNFVRAFGEAHSRTKISDIDIAAMEVDRASMTFQELGIKYGLSYSHCCKIINGKSRIRRKLILFMPGVWAEWNQNIKT
jgi:hypothetical protein